MDYTEIKEINTIIQLKNIYSGLDMIEIDVEQEKAHEILIKQGEQLNNSLLFKLNSINMSLLNKALQSPNKNRNIDEILNEMGKNGGFLPIKRGGVRQKVNYTKQSITGKTDIDVQLYNSYILNTNVDKTNLEISQEMTDKSKYEQQGLSIVKNKSQNISLKKKKKRHINSTKKIIQDIELINEIKSFEKTLSTMSFQEKNSKIKPSRLQLERKFKQLSIQKPNFNSSSTQYGPQEPQQNKGQEINEKINEIINNNDITAKTIYPIISDNIIQLDESINSQCINEILQEKFIIVKQICGSESNMEMFATTFLSNIMQYIQFPHPFIIYKAIDSDSSNIIKNIFIRIRSPTYSKMSNADSILTNINNLESRLSPIQGSSIRNHMNSSFININLNDTGKQHTDISCTESIKPEISMEKEQCRRNIIQSSSNQNFQSEQHIIILINSQDQIVQKNTSQTKIESSDSSEDNVTLNTSQNPQNTNQTIKINKLPEEKPKAIELVQMRNIIPSRINRSNTITQQSIGAFMKRRDSAMIQKSKSDQPNSNKDKDIEQIENIENKVMVQSEKKNLYVKKQQEQIKQESSPIKKSEIQLDILDTNSNQYFYKTSQEAIRGASQNHIIELKVYYFRMDEYLYVSVSKHNLNSTVHEFVRFLIDLFQNHHKFDRGLIKYPDFPDVYQLKPIDDDDQMSYPLEITLTNLLDLVEKTQFILLQKQDYFVSLVNQEDLHLIQQLEGEKLVYNCLVQIEENDKIKQYFFQLEEQDKVGILLNKVKNILSNQYIKKKYYKLIYSYEPQNEINLEIPIKLLQFKKFNLVKRKYEDHENKINNYQKQSKYSGVKCQKDFNNKGILMNESISQINRLGRNNKSEDELEYQTDDGKESTSDVTSKEVIDIQKVGKLEEFSIQKISKSGIRKQRIIGIDYYKIYSKKTGSEFSIFKVIGWTANKLCGNNSKSSYQQNDRLIDDICDCSWSGQKIQIDFYDERQKIKKWELYDVNIELIQLIYNKINKIKKYKDENNSPIK